MSSGDALEWLLSTQYFGIKLGLDNIRLLLAELGNPQDRLAIIHVAGTNGKGSVCALIDSIARAGGLKSGLYTSPHLVDLRERFRVNGEKIPPATQLALLEKIRAVTASWEYPPTLFEITTALALRFFADESCDIVVLETGLGGRLDATNVVTPKAVVLTPIDLDHTHYLGNTLTEVAGEKAGIIKPSIPVLSAPQQPEAARVIETRAAALSAPLRFVEESVAAPVALAGVFQKQNAALALAALAAGGWSFPPEVIAQGLATVVWPGRFQRVGDRLVLDGSHNPHAARSLVENWREHFGDTRATILFGAMQDKDFTEVLRILSPIAARFGFVTVQNERSATPRDFRVSATIPTTDFPSLAAALPWARAQEAPVLVTGSLFLIGEAFAALGLEV